MIPLYLQNLYWAIDDYLIINFTCKRKDELILSRYLLVLNMATYNSKNLKLNSRFRLELYAGFSRNACLSHFVVFNVHTEIRRCWKMMNNNNNHLHSLSCFIHDFDRRLFNVVRTSVEPAFLEPIDFHHCYAVQVEMQGVIYNDSCTNVKLTSRHNFENNVRVSPMRTIINYRNGIVLFRWWQNYAIYQNYDKRHFEKSQRIYVAVIIVWHCNTLNKVSSPHAHA